MRNSRLFGLMAEYDNPGDLLVAAKTAYEEGYRKMDAYSPMPVHGLSEAIGFRRTNLPLLVLVGGVIGCLTGFGMQWVVETIIYPLNVGGRPYNSWPSFVPITFEVTVLFAALTAVLGMLALNRLPEPYHPVFSAPRFEMASREHFFLCIEADDPKFDLEATRKFLETTHGKEIVELER